jgi:hypothetical protein
MTGTSNDGREDSPGGVITGKASFAHSGTIVHDKSGNILVTHLDEIRLKDLIRFDITESQAV